ncbi:hypothetical protein HAP47_0023070 [Bradyrhizobium sp. 41S5]|uniref:hypothetical protein n=1 Tax=Bradyrhizobium sp. 41S5 TaxID=1404443 RepID=UPI00156ACC6E|nr:hypothetical protein [Bradyrhizobium sp. 41S5]UFX42145.1 hypothetical protein HAP47_0023070 [Bradyrhizobium sp. 41S5]
MTILDRPPPDWKRPTTPCRVKLQVLINQGGRSKINNERLGTVDNTHFDHRPALEARKFDTERWDTIPPANDPEHIDAITLKQHDVRTNGPGGTKRITTRGSDTGERARTRNIARSHADHQDVMTAKITGQPRPEPSKPKRKLMGRSSFPKRQSRKFG